VLWLALRGAGRFFIETAHDDLRSFARPGIPVLHATRGAGCRRRRGFFQGNSRSASRTLRLRSPPTAFRRGDRLALLLPNFHEYIELVYACSWLGVTAVPINARLSAAEIDRVLLDANRVGWCGISLPQACGAGFQWQIVLDESLWTFGKDNKKGNERTKNKTENNSVQILFMTRKRFSLSSIPVARRTGRRASW